MAAKEAKPVELRGVLTLAQATFSEMAGLIIWLQLVDDGKILAGIVVLVLSQLSERIAVILVTDDAYRGRPFPTGFYAPAVSSAFVESAAWIIWLWLWDTVPGGSVVGIVVATLAMFVMQLYSHSWTMSTVLNKPPFSRYARDPLSIGFSAVEALTAGGWLLVSRGGNLVLAAVVVLVGLTIEHIMQVLVLERELPPNFVEG